MEGEGLTRAVFVATCDGSQIDDIIVALHNAGLEMVALHDRPQGSILGSYHYVIEAENADGVTEAQISTVSSIACVRFLGRFNAAEKKGDV